ncbi:MAG: hypothetical protein O7C59_07985, partial [Rickettsia endosymbiont of Ixodes persulcatus]|nr:hypothetical protein [Rickettsia endosymbiont of Ixodes persulcatus]
MLVEVTELVDTMLRHAKLIFIEVIGKETVDVVGIGGDGVNIVNLLMMVLIVVVVCGIFVVKHGNWVVFLFLGGVDMFEVFGVCIDLGFDEVVRSVVEVGIGFVFALQFHLFYWHAFVVCWEIGVFMVFNLLGLLINPAVLRAGFIGCVWGDLVEVMVGVFVVRNSSVLVVHGDDGFDELMITMISIIWWVQAGMVEWLMFDFVVFGFARVDLSELRGGDVEVNVNLV